jgi:hypothetical protein
MENHRIVSREQWIAARTALLAKEKEFTRARDLLSQERRDLPWVRVDKAEQVTSTAGACRPHFRDRRSKISPKCCPFGASRPGHLRPGLEAPWLKRAAKSSVGPKSAGREIDGSQPKNIVRVHADESARQAHDAVQPMT